MTKVNKNFRIIDIAEKAGVSRAAASLVLTGTGRGRVRVSKETSQKIRTIAAELNFTPNLAAQQLAGKKSKLIGLLTSNIQSELNNTRLAEIEMHARNHGYHSLIMHGIDFTASNKDDLEECVSELISRGIDGIICFPHMFPDDPAYIPRMVSSRIKNVVFIDKPAIDGFSWVGPNYADGSRQAVRYFLNSGRTRIGLAISDLKWYSGPLMKNGYTEELANQGLEVDESLIWVANRDDSNISQDLSPKLAEDIVDYLVHEKQADAIYAINDYWAGQITTCLKEQGINVPYDVAVLGWGNTHFVNYIRPMLTSIDLQLKRVSAIAVEMLIDLLENENTEAKEVLIKPTIVIRGSA